MSGRACEPGRGSAADELPEYCEALHAFHTAAAPELFALYESLPLSASALVLDVACGDGCHALGIGRRAGRVIGIDRSTACLRVARSRGLSGTVRADASSLPFADACVDLVFCAHSLGSLVDHRATFAEMARVLRRGGWLAVLESDPAHRILLPWDPELEREVRVAQLEGLTELARLRDLPLDTFTCAGRLDQVLRDYGFVDCERRALVIERRAPLRPDEEHFLGDYFADLRLRASGHLGAERRRVLETLTSPDSPAYLPRDPSFHYAQLEVLALARR
jgi:ubiquinone/menaquinone biosynthesis C-methylase UbiE